MHNWLTKHKMALILFFFFFPLVIVVLAPEQMNRVTIHLEGQTNNGKEAVP